MAEYRQRAAREMFNVLNFKLIDDTFMDEYNERVVREIFNALNFKFSDVQLGLVGRVLSLEEESSLVSSVKIDHNYIRAPSEISMSVILQSELYNEEHEVIMEKIKGNLSEKGVDTSKLFSYCQKSYGIEDLENTNIHFGFGR